jgi:hypothetical protein
MRSGSEAPLALITARRVENDDLVSFETNELDVRPGDAQFFDDNERVGRLHLRPLLKSERTPRAQGEYPPGAHWLVYFSETGKQLRAIVRIPFNRRRNLQASIGYAVQQVANFNLAYGVLFRVAQGGKDPFTTPITVIYDQPSG